MVAAAGGTSPAQAGQDHRRGRESFGATECNDPGSPFLSHGAVRFLLRIIEAIFLLALVGAAVLAWRLSQGPIAIDAIAPYVAEAFTDPRQGVKFQVEHLEFKWFGFKGEPELAARNVRLLDASGGVVAGVPNMVVRLSP